MRDEALRAAVAVAAAYGVRCAAPSVLWDGSNVLHRQIGNNAPREAAWGVSAFAWYIDGSPPNQTVVAVISVTVQSYTETQTLRFYPRVNP